jgi:hypothetical protein
MRKNQFLSNLLATTFICGAASVATPAFAQADASTQPQAGPAAATQPSDDQGQEVVITGSRIPAPPNLTAVSPVTVVNSAEIRLQGTTRTEDLINSLPQSFGGQGGNLANGASGTATVNLRGLGTNRTMVLINGRRLGPGDPEQPNPDINVIPSAIVSRVDVLTGGASSVYGSDAVSGVVNFIMDTELTGIRIDSQYSFYQHNNRHEDAGDGLITGPLGQNARGFGHPSGSVADGGAFDVSVAFGTGFDDNRGHIVAYAGYRQLNAVTQGRRDYSSCVAQAPTAGQVATRGRLFCGGSATSANGTAFILVPTGVPAHPFTSTIFQVGPNRTFIPGFQAYNFAPTNYYQRPDERYTLGAFANYEISPALQPYLEVMFMDDRTVAQIAPSGDFGNTFSVNCNNPLLSAQQRAIVCAPYNLLSGPDIRGQAPRTVGGDANNGIVSAPFVFLNPDGTPYFRGFAQILRRNVEGGGRRDDLQHTNYRIAMCGRTTCTITSRRPTSRRPTRTTSRSRVCCGRSTSSTIPQCPASSRSAARSSTAATRAACPMTSSPPGRSRRAPSAICRRRASSAAPTSRPLPAPRSPAISATGASSSRGRRTASASRWVSSIARRCSPSRPIRHSRCCLPPTSPVRAHRPCRSTAAST